MAIPLPFVDREGFPSKKTIGKGQLSYMLWADTGIRRVDGGYEFGSREAEFLYIIDLCVIWMSFLRPWGDGDFTAGFDWLAKSQGTQSKRV
jgi:hypothetical protein